MRTKEIKRFFIITTAATILLLLYVHQNISIIMLGYEVSNRDKLLANCIDRHRHLVYNLNKLESPSVLSSKLYVKNIDLVEADARRIFYAGTAKKTVLAKRTSQNSGKKNIFDSFTVTAEARSRR